MGMKLGRRDRDASAFIRVLSFVGAVFVFVAGCSDDSSQNLSTTSTAETVPEAVPDAEPAVTPRFARVSLDMPADMLSSNPEQLAARSAYFGDLHVHTEYSFDAFAFGTIATPYDAYRYAQGEAIKHPAGFDVQLREPLDFYAVTDHAMFLGTVKEAADTTSEFSKQDYVAGLHNLNAPENLNVASLPSRFAAFQNFLPSTLAGIADGSVDEDMINRIIKNAWADSVKAADEHYKPGTFTTFVAYEYTSSTDDRGNLHRNVIFRDSDRLPAVPFSRFHSQNPEGLWDWMDDLRARGMEALAIPHNSNGSNGQMFKLVDWAGDPMDEAYAAQRSRNEPLVELTQVKGTSETHPLLSTTDEWADFEIMPYRVATTLPSEPRGSYAREALLNGLAFEDKGLTSPYRFGFVGASDTHTAASTLEEESYFSKAGLIDADGQRRGSVPLNPEDAAVMRQTGLVNVLEIGEEEYSTGAYDTWGASGLTGVWAEENTRESIYRAFRRKETFATSGPRIRVSLFAGYDLGEEVLQSVEGIAKAYRTGVSMGSDLLARGDDSPFFVARAVRDSKSAPLERLQIVKGWTIDGRHHEKVFDVACSSGEAPNPETHRCSDNGSSVDTKTCATTEGSGAGELQKVWQDPEFNPNHRAFYYLRVLENPTCRWSTWDAIKAGVAPRPDLPPTLQERAWSSSIWFMPAA